MILNRILSPIVCVAALIASPLLHAQLLEDIEFRRDGADAVLQVKFVAPVQFSRAVGARNGDLVEVFYTWRPTADQVQELSSEKRLPATGALPSVIVSDDSSVNNTPQAISRKLVVRFGKRLAYRVRPGRNEQSIDIILTGLASAVLISRPAVALASVSAPPGRFFITIQSNAQEGQPLRASVPANLQAYQVFTATRLVDGKTYHDVNIGYFSSAQEAEGARQLALARFPDTTIGEKPLAPAEIARPIQTPDPAKEVPTRTEAQAQAGVSQNRAEPSAMQSSADVEKRAAELLTAAQMAFDGGNYLPAIDGLNELLNLPPNTSSRRAQEMIGLARLNAGDTAKANGEFELFVKTYPVGPDSDRIRQLIASAPAAAQVSSTRNPAAEPTSTTTGSVSSFFYGGNSDVRTQEFRDSVLGGLPILQSDSTLSSIDQKQIQSNLDMTWRYKDNEKDMRFVLRDAYSVDLLPNGLSKERLSALYFDYRSLTNGTSMRLGRQSPNGGGVLYRFDGIQAGYAFKPKWKINAVYGSPTDTLLDTRRNFFGLSLDAEALTKELSGSAYLIEQTIDGETDRRAIGFDLRYFKGGLSASTQVDYDQILKVVNIAAFQSTWQISEASMVNAAIDRRTTPILSLGNVLFFQDPALTSPARRIQELLGTTSIETLRDQVVGLAAYQTQARLGGTTAISQKWQVGGDVSVTNIDEIKPVAVLLPAGQPSTGNLWSIGMQLIGTNLYSPRDTHVFNLTALGGPTYRGALLSYNNLSSINEKWQLEPALKYYTQADNSGASSKTWTAGIRAVYRVLQHVALESDLTYERVESISAPVAGTSGSSSSSRFNYSFGGRYDF